jgi:C4-type Zn-finger protein
VRDRRGDKIECPVCRKADVHYSKSDTLATFLMGMLFNMDALRCYTCQNLFYRRTAVVDETEPHPRRKK